MIPGIDVAFQHPSYSGVKAAGYQFVVRYLTRSHPPKLVTRPEIDAIRGAGLQLCLVFEDGARRATSGYSAGIADAGLVVALLGALKLPAHSVVYFAVDFNPDTSEMVHVLDYFEGIGKVLPKAQIGVYGGYTTVRSMWYANVLGYAWQTYAWSNGQWFSRAQLRQVKNGVHVAGAEVDTDQATSTNYGGVFTMEDASNQPPVIPDACATVWHPQVIPIAHEGGTVYWSAAGTLSHLHQMVIDLGASVAKLTELVTSQSVTPAEAPDGADQVNRESAAVTPAEAQSDGTESDPLFEDTLDGGSDTPIGDAVASATIAPSTASPAEEG